MIKKSTLSDLLSYAYNESDLCEGDRIQRTIDGDPLVQQEFTELTGVINTLDQAKPEPSEEVIKKILQFC